MDKKQYPLSCPIKVWKQFEKLTKKEYKTMNAKLIELILKYIEESNG
jgi:hypothetical protein